MVYRKVFGSCVSKVKGCRTRKCTFCNSPQLYCTFAIFQNNTVRLINIPCLLDLKLLLACREKMFIESDITISCVRLLLEDITLRSIFIDALCLALDELAMFC